MAIKAEEAGVRGVVAAGGLSLASAIADYAIHQELRGDSRTHRQECRRILRLLLDTLGDLAVDEVRAEHLRLFLASIRRRPGVRTGQPISDLTVVAYDRTARAFFRFLEQQEIIAVSPMGRIPKPKTSQHLVRPFSDHQVGAILAQPDRRRFAGLRDLALMLFLLDTGCRVSESLALRVDDVDLESRLARVFGKGRKERIVPFGRQTAACLSRYLRRRERRAASPYLFINTEGHRLTRGTVGRRIAAYGRNAGITGVRVSPHTFRHTFAINWLVGHGDYKGDTLSLQRVLGHSTPVMTARYVHLAGQDLRRLHDRLSPVDHLAPTISRRRRAKRSA